MHQIKMGQEQRHFLQEVAVAMLPRTNYDLQQALVIAARELIAIWNHADEGIPLGEEGSRLHCVGAVWHISQTTVPD